MDIYSFINSKDIREYLKQIQYQFSSLETAWLIYACRALSFKQKKAQWEQMMISMPDCEVPCVDNCVEWNSLHSCLKRYIHIIDQELAEFYKEKPQGEYVYMYSYLYQGDEEWTECETIYSSLKECLEAYHRDVQDMDETYYPDGTGVIRYRLRRQLLMNGNDVMKVECFNNGDLVDVLRNDQRDEEDERIINKLFEGLWFDFPTPFKKGDVVWIPPASGNVRRVGGDPFVLRGLSTWKPLNDVEVADNSDMNGYGYFANPNGTIYYEITGNYMDLEYYPEPYNLNEKILPVLGKFLKGEIEIDLLLCAYRKFLLDVASDDIMLSRWYPKKLLNDIGMELENVEKTR